MLITDHSDLWIYQHARKLAALIYQLAQTFPPDERFRLADQIIRSSRAVAACIAEAWRKRAYPFHFVSKLTDAESEAAETRAWLDVALDCACVDEVTRNEIDGEYRRLLAGIVSVERDAQRYARFNPRKSAPKSQPNP